MLGCRRIRMVPRGMGGLLVHPSSGSSAFSRPPSGLSSLCRLDPALEQNSRCEKRAWVAGVTFCKLHRVDCQTVELCVTTIHLLMA